MVRAPTGSGPIAGRGWRATEGVTSSAREIAGEFTDDAANRDPITSRGASRAQTRARMLEMCAEAAERRLGCAVVGRRQFTRREACGASGQLSGIARAANVEGTHG